MANNLHWFITIFPRVVTELPMVLDFHDERLFHHLKTVIRTKPGQQIVLVDFPEAQAYLCTVKSLKNKVLTVSIEEALPPKPRPNMHTTALVSLIKSSRWDWMLQKLTELGIDEILPLETQRSIIDIKDPDNKLARWEDICKNAAEQSERLTLPMIYPPETLSACLDSLPSDEQTLKLVASERGGTPLHAVLSEAGHEIQRVLFAIGPEGGWANDELALLEARGFHAVHFGDTILRSETAALYLQAVLQNVSHSHTSAPS